MPSSKPPKKSETLEVRLSYADKLNLQKKAQQNGLSVSEVIRDQISDYLTPSHSRTLPQHIMEKFMRVPVKTKSALATAGVLVLGSLAITPLSAAEEIGLKLQGSAIQTEGDGTRTRRFETDILLGEGHSIALGLNGAELNPTNFKANVADDIMMTISVRKVADGVLISMKIEMNVTTDEGTETKLLAQPSVTANFDEKATIEIIYESDNVFTLFVTPTKSL